MPIPFELLTVARVGARTVPIQTLGSLQQSGPTTDPATLSRLDFHRFALEAAGVQDLSALGTLTLGGAIVPSIGVTTPPPPSDPGGPTGVTVTGATGVTGVEGEVTMFSNARAGTADGTGLTVIGGRAVQLASIPLTTPVLSSGTSPLTADASSSTAIAAAPVQPLAAPFFMPEASPEAMPLGPMPVGRRPIETGPAPVGNGSSPPISVPRMLRVNVDIAYWAATRIELLDDTVVVMRFPVQALVLIAETIVIGQRVTFTWEPFAISSIDPPNTPLPKGQQPKAIYLAGVEGDPGDDGSDGSPGWQGHDAPQLEIWTLNMTGKPIVDLHGQDGGLGGSGGRGGNGGQGSEGRDEFYGFLGFCASAAGSGGNGGPGGGGGDGGRGGNGGQGGTFSFYSTTPTLLAYASGFTADCSGGSAGVGGSGGASGAGGSGANAGAHPRPCQPTPGRLIQNGQTGQPGQPGVSGTAGDPGATSPDAISMLVITRDDFFRKLEAPAIFSISPTQTHVGDTIAIHGARFSATDVVVINTVVVTPSYSGESLLTLVVPAVGPGNNSLHVRQTDGTLSNLYIIVVIPTITSINPNTNVRPSSPVRISGGGFASSVRVLVEGQNVSPISVLSAGEIEFTLIRPPNPRLNANEDEVVTIEVALLTGERSNPFDVTLDTLRVVVVGDSIIWGQGLVSQDKMHTLVANQLQLARGNIRVETTVLAHSGATIGVGDSTVMPTLDGEVPTSYPTALQQVDMFSDVPTSVDYVLVLAGMNDINVRNILNPTVAESVLTASILQHCQADMRTLLGQITQKFTTATVVVCGYYPLVSEETDLLLIGAFATAIGLDLGGIPGATITGIATIWLKDQLVSRCKMFDQLSRRYLQQAVNDTNIALINNYGESSHRVRFAGPEFDKTHSMLASTPWLFGIDLLLNPQDPQVAGARSIACVAAGSARTDVEVCKRASIGHPNIQGAAIYSGEILSALNRTQFPANFLWGVATAGKQVEGNITGDDWEVFTTDPTIISRVNSTPTLMGQPALDLKPAGIAVNHGDLKTLALDLDRAKAIGCNAYRFSLEWSRIEPTATGGFDPSAIAYYDSAIDLMRQRGMTPIATLNHLTLPKWVLTPPSGLSPEPVMPGDAFLSSLMGWENPTTVARFVAYVIAVTTQYKLKVNTWITFNEPVGSMIGVGYLGGVWPPGFIGGGGRGKTAYFNLLKAHVAAYDAIKVVYGTTPSFISAAHNMMFAKLSLNGGGFGNINVGAVNQFDYFYNWHFLDSLMSGTVDTEIAHRPADQIRVSAASFYGVAPGPNWIPRLDFIGLNFYRSVYVEHQIPLALAAPYTGGNFDNNLLDEPKVTNVVNSVGWEVYPKGLLMMLRRLHAAYGCPIMITENGWPEPADCNRASFLVAHLRAVEQALAEGIPVTGYLHWSLIDNWEWQENYSPKARFGLFTVDRTTDPSGKQLLTRHITDAALAFRYLVSSRSVAEAEERFGSISACGDTLLYPSRINGAMWEGITSDGRNVTLWVSSFDGGQQITGLLCFADSQSWHAVTGIRTSGAMFKIDMPDDAGQLSIINLDLSSNVLKWQNGPIQFNLDRAKFHGAWFTKAPGSIVATVGSTRLEGALLSPTAKLSFDNGNRKWSIPTAAALTASGGVDLDISGIQFHGVVDSATGDLVGTTSLPGSFASTSWAGKRLKDIFPPPSFNTKRLVEGQNASGTLEVFYIGTDDVLYHNWQQTPGGAWSGENLLGTGTSKAKALVLSQNANGTLEVFYIGTDDVLYHNWQQTPGGAWNGENLLGTATNQAKTMAVGQNASGTLEVFYIGTDDVLYHNWQQTPGGAWNGENLLGTATNQGKALAVGQNASGTLEVFYIGTDDVLYHNWQQTPGGAWNGENLLGTATNQGKALAVGQNASGTLEVFYIGTDDVLYHNWQTSPGGAWDGENLLGTATNQAKTLAVGRNASGTLEAFYNGTDDVLYHNWQTSPGGTWNGENLLGTVMNKGKALAVGRNAGGTLEAFYVGTDDNLYHNWQTSPGGAWSGENVL